MTVATQSPEPASAQRGSHRRAPRRRWIVALACLLGLGVDTLSAQEDVTGTDDLRTRVEELEKTNRALIQALRDQQVLEDDPSSDETDDSDDEGFQFYPIADKADSKKSGEGKAADKKASPPEEEWYEVGSDLSMSASWNNGLELATKNKDFRVHVGAGPNSIRPGSSSRKMSMTIRVCATRFMMVWTSAAPGCGSMARCGNRSNGRPSSIS